jgi:hypothetical protein
VGVSNVGVGSPANKKPRVCADTLWVSNATVGMAREQKVRATREIRVCGYSHVIGIRLSVVEPSLGMMDHSYRERLLIVALRINKLSRTFHSIDLGQADE